MLTAINNMFGFIITQPIYETLANFRVLHITAFVVSVWLTLDAWSYMKEYALLYPDAQWLTAAMPSFIVSTAGAAWAMVAEARKVLSK